MVMNPYAAGKKVYRGGSSAATMGHVDPMGYVIRERHKRTMQKAAARRAAASGRGIATAPSQSRSGLAAAFIKRATPGIKGPQAGEHGNTRPRPKPKPKSKPHKPKPKPGQTPGTKPTPPPVTSLPSDTDPDQNTVVASPNGALNLPWNRENRARAIAAQQRYDQGLQQNTREFQDYDANYNEQLRRAGQQYGVQQDSTLDSAAGRGMAFSSGYGKAVANDATNYNNYQTDMGNDRAQFLTASEEQKNQYRNDFYDTVRGLAIDQGIDLEQYAGSLGYGRDQSDVLPTRKPVGGGKGKPKPKPHKPKPGTKPLTRRQRRRRRQRRLDREHPARARIVRHKPKPGIKGPRRKPVPVVGGPKPKPKPFRPGHTPPTKPVRVTAAIRAAALRRRRRLTKPTPGTKPRK